MSVQSVTVLVDTREQRPFLFPETLALWQPREAGRAPKADIVKVAVKKVRLDAGDYCLEGAESVAIFERKSGIVELIGNTLSDDRPRFLRALHKLAKACDYPYLFVEELPPKWWTPGGDVPMSYGLEAMQAVDELLYHLTRLDIRLWWGSSFNKNPSRRRRVGELVLRTLIHHAT